MISTDEAINNFYEFKTLYENSYNKEKKDLINNKKISWDEKRIRFKQLKYKCINCKRPVGTIFSQKFSSDEYNGFKTLLAVCGDTVNPCPLNINIKIDNVYFFEDIIKSFETDIKEYKNSIIKDKNDLLFGYTTTENVLRNFNDYKILLNQTYDIKNYYLELLINTTDNPEKKIELEKLLIESYDIIQNIKQDIQNFNTDNNVQLINDTIKNNYIDLLMTKPAENNNPIEIGKLEKIRNLKYANNSVEYDEDTHIYSLNQQINTIQKLEVPYSSEVINYVVGVVKAVSKSKTKKTKKTPNKTSKKVRLIIKDTSSSENKEPEQIEQIEQIEEPTNKLPIISSKSPIISPDNSISWEDQTYKKVWNFLSEQHKIALANDPAWLQESMDTYANLYNSKKQVKFLFPSNITFPPELSSDNKADFDNELYNKIVNENPFLIQAYLKDKNKQLPNADVWFKSSVERQIYTTLYPKASQLIIL